MIDPVLITADDKHRAAPVRLFSPQYRRLLGFLWPHRRALVIGAIASVLHALLNTAGISVVLPITTILLEEQGLHGWVYRSMAERRLGADLDTISRPQPDGNVSIHRVQILKVRRGSPLDAADVSPASETDTLDGEQLAPIEWFRRVALTPQDATVTLGVMPSGSADGSPVSASVRLRDAPAHWRAAASAVGLLPFGQPLRALLAVMGVLVVVAIASNIFRFLSEYLVSTAILRSLMDLRRKLYAKVLRLPMAFFARDVGDTVSRFVQDVHDVQRGLMALFGNMIREPLKALAIFTWALFLDWRITLTLLLVGPLAILLFWRIGESVKKASTRLLRGYGMIIGALSASLHTANIVKAYTAENTERRRFWRIDRKMLAQQKKMVRLDALLSPSLEVIAVASICGLTIWLGAQVIGGTLDQPRFVALIVTLAMMFDPIRKVADVYTRVQRSAAGASRIFDVYDRPDETSQNGTAPKLAPLAERIEFRDVTFVYPHADRPALDHVSLSVHKGETVAIVGPNGSGKTTLMSMLLRFYDPLEGAVRFDGVDLRNVSLRSLRRQISLVTQEAVVFAAPIAENIAYGARGATREQIIDAAGRAYAADFINRLPKGYDTVVGERGATLSGGERQRLAIARAILRDAPILIFDEATSQVDSESEQKIQAALRELVADRTTLIVAHRLSTIKFASRIVVMDAGRIIDTGSHEQLLARCPFYHGLCETQLVH